MPAVAELLVAALAKPHRGLGWAAGARRVRRG
jgi:hypothetical protein